MMVSVGGVLLLFRQGVSITCFNYNGSRNDNNK